MTMPHFNMRQLLEAGVHFGHRTYRWNPHMEPFIFGKKNDIHILDLSQTVPLLHQALIAIKNTVAKGGRVLFVGTKRQASEHIARSAKESAQYYINHRWLGGTLTNWDTISSSIKTLRELDETLEQDNTGLTKNETLRITRNRDKLERALGGIRDMGGAPDIIFIIDTNREAIAVREAQKLKIPIVAVIDSNSDPNGIDYPIPGNDDSGRAIELYCSLVADAAIDGIGAYQTALGRDMGADENPPQEESLQEEAPQDESPQDESRQDETTPSEAQKPETQIPETPVTETQTNQPQPNAPSKTDSKEESEAVSEDPTENTQSNDVQTVPQSDPDHTTSNQ